MKGEGEEHPVGAEGHVPGVGRQVGQQDQVGEEVESGCQVVLAGPDRVEAEGSGLLDLVDQMPEVGSGVVALGML